MSKQGKNQPDKVGQRCGYMKEVHGDDPRNIGNLKDTPNLAAVVSPPYGEAMNKKHTDHKLYKEKKWNTKYSKDPSNIGNLKDNKNPEEEFDITQFHSCDEDLYWKGCYGSFRNWKKYVTDESWAHPAKMSPKLCDRIFKHLKKMGLLKDGDTVVDFMGGIGTTNIIASLHKCDSVSIELEKHFCDMAKNNKKKMWEHCQFCTCDEEGDNR